jgi:hypothetical protein
MSNVKEVREIHHTEIDWISDTEGCMVFSELAEELYSCLRVEGIHEDRYFYFAEYIQNEEYNNKGIMYKSEKPGIELFFYYK